MKAKPICLRCEKEPAYTKPGFTSAWCPKCHLEKFGCTHEEKSAFTLTPFQRLQLELFDGLKEKMK